MVDALTLTASWPVDNVAAAVVGPRGSVATIGDTARRFRLASIAKPITTWACLVAVEEQTVRLDQPAGQTGCTLRHLLSHAGGYPFNGQIPIAQPERTRIYSNTGIEIAAAAVAEAAGMPFGQYLTEAVLAPLGMNDTQLKGSAAYGLVSTIEDVLRFVHEVRAPRLIAPSTATEATSVQFPQLNGTVPGVGRFSPCPWGLGFEIRGTKRPHWTGTTNSPETFGHFGGAGTFLWVDPAVGVASIAVTDRPFDDWASDALRLWPAFSDAVLAEVTR
jgi:CubicO group peptidase (beta-lactamase class C family)